MVFITYLAFAAAGAVGAVARYGMMKLIQSPHWPWATFVINVTGAFFLGWFLTVAEKRLGLSVNWRLAIGTGFVGAYTTFSTFMFESDKLLRDGEWLRAVTYLTASVFVGLLVVRLGFLLGDRM